MKIRAHVLISGRVQGVFFRAFTREKALEHDVKGWVRNLLDGRVEAVLEGEKQMVQNVLEELKKGPSHAKVDEVEVKHEGYIGEFPDFSVKR